MYAAGLPDHCVCYMLYGHGRTGQHPFGGGQTEFCPNGFGAGGSSRAFPGSKFSGGGGTSRNFQRPIRWGVVAEFFPLTAVTDPTFVLFKHVLCYARIKSTLCPNVCRQTARIGGGGQLPPCPPRPVRLCVWADTNLCFATDVKNNTR